MPPQAKMVCLWAKTQLKKSVNARAKLGKASPANKNVIFFRVSADMVMQQRVVGEMDMPKIIKNAIRCKKCRDIIESKTVHDFKFCSCGSCAVDGGHDYLRRCGNLGDW